MNHSQDCIPACIVYQLALLLRSRSEFWIQYSNHLNEELSVFIQVFPGVGGSLLNSLV